MSDEIDIEEHDVLQNPAVKILFPDLSVIKKEIIEYYEEEANASSLSEEIQTAPFQIKYQLSRQQCSSQEESPLVDWSQEVLSIEDSSREESLLGDSCQGEVVPLQDSCHRKTVRLEDSRQGEAVPLEDSYHRKTVRLEDSCQGKAAPLENSCQGEAVPLEDSCHRKTVRLEDSCQGKAVPLENSCQGEAVPIEDSCHRKTVRLEDSCQGKAVPIENSCHRESVPLQDSCHREAVPLEDSCHGEANIITKYIQNSELSTANTYLASEATETQKTSRYLHRPVIVLGSKSTLECNKHIDNSLNKEPKLILKNVNSFLKRCRRFCKDCHILFPKEHLFNIHLIDMHTRDNQIPFMGKQEGNKLFKCNACDKSLSCQSNLFRHFRNIHGDVKTLKTVYRSNNKIVPNEASQSEDTIGLSCFHCQQLFPTQSSLIEHLYKVLDPKKFGPNDSSKSSTKVKEPNSQFNRNNRLKEGQCVKHMNKINPNRKNSLVANSRPRGHSKSNKDSGDSEGVLPHKNYPTRRPMANVVGLAESGAKNIPEKKRKTNCDQLQNVDAKTKKLETKEYYECNKQLDSEKELTHLCSLHPEISNNSKNKRKSSVGKEISNIQNITVVQSMFYKCFICSKYNVSFEFYSRHIMNDHNVKEVTEVKPVPFESQCKFCTSKMSGIKSYNVHLYRYHKKQLKEPYLPCEEQPVNTASKHHKKVGKKVMFALKSILYKCMKCDLFFLSSDAAMDHLKHLRITDTWKCSVCQRIFGRENMALHEKQHSFSQSFTVHTLFAFSQVLYKCSNCTVHYSEENFLLHYLKCDLETPNSLYCKDCDILINKDDMECHEINHKEKQIMYSDFIIIESDMIDDRDISTNTPETESDNSNMKHDHDRYISTGTANRKSVKSYKLRDRHASPNTALLKNGTAKKTRFGMDSLEHFSKFAMSFCDTCKCFIGNVNMRKLHVEGKCGHMLGYVCKDCGLMLTTKTLATHKEYHKQEQISLHDYVFYELKSGKRICPPIPDYPKCNSCGVHFLRNHEIRIHSCQEQDYITCNVCSMKLTEDAHKLHIHFHSYLIPSLNTKVKKSAVQANPANGISDVEPNSSVSDDAYIINAMTFYTCNSCQLTVNTYDKVVQHCQDHYDSKVVQLSMQKCQNCTLMLRMSDYENHSMLHLNGKYNKDSINIVDFDPFYFRYNNDFWTQHIFAYVADEDISKILRNSIYRYECRLKMEKIQSGSSNSVLYRCDKCKVFVDPQYLYMHAVNSVDNSCVKLRKHPCEFCGLSFASLAYRIAHEKEHEHMEMNLQSYKIVLYNKEEHETYNNIMYDASNQYILFQCRNCEGVVDKFERNTHKCDVINLKICSTCGLLFHMKDLDLHTTRHEDLDQFNVANIIVVMFGKPNPGKKKLRSTFTGTKYDHTMYKCKKCDLCFRTKECVSEHVCVFDTSKCECPKCGLFFLKTDLKCHEKVHETNLEFDDLNMNLIPFDASSAILHVDTKDKLGENIDLVKQAEEVVETTEVIPEKQDIIYKCDCGLHFVEELNAKQHSSICNTRIKISKQSCFRCDLLFTPGELFNHLLKHHYDKKLKFKFDVVPVSKI